MGWNGLDLVNDFAGELGDTSNAFKTKCLRWVNEGVREIATSHEWPFLREKGQVTFIAGENTQSLVLSKPSAPTVAALTGGSLALLNEYKVLVTFLEGASGVESIAGEPSAGITPLGPDLSITLTSIPVSTSPLVTARKIYVSKNGASYALYSTISNNTATTGTVTADTTSPIVPPEENAIHVIDGDLFIEGQRVLSGTSLQDLIFSSNAVSSSGTPQSYALVNQEEVRVNPKPSSSVVVSFYYFKLPARVYGVSTSIPQIPSWLYEDLRNYVIWRGFNYRDRSGQESKKINFDNGLRITISRKGFAAKKSGRVRCVTPDSDGAGV
jgi:hypothetical protein